VSVQARYPGHIREGARGSEAPPGSSPSEETSVFGALDEADDRLVVVVEELQQPAATVIPTPAAVDDDVLLCMERRSEAPRRSLLPSGVARAGHRVAAASRAGRKRQSLAASGDVLLDSGIDGSDRLRSHRVMP
jgi:hypothetical protein